jgi:hypothetical protein
MTGEQFDCLLVAGCVLCVAVFRVILRRRLWNVSVDVACTGVTGEQIDCLLHLLCFCKVKASMVRLR